VQLTLSTSQARKGSGSDVVERESFNGELEIETDQAYNDWTEAEPFSRSLDPGKPNATRSEDDGFFDDSDGLDYGIIRTAEPSNSNEEYM